MRLTAVGKEPQHAFQVHAPHHTGHVNVLKDRTETLYQGCRKLALKYTV